MTNALKVQKLAITAFIAVVMAFLFLNLFTVQAHAAGLLDETIDTAHEFSRYPIDNYQLDFYVDSSWDWLPWNWLDGIGKTAQYAIYLFTNFLWTLNLYISNAVGYLIQQAYDLDFISSAASEIGKNIQLIAGVSASGFDSTGLFPGMMAIVTLLVGVYCTYVGLVKRETTKAFHAALNFAVVFVVSVGLIAYAPSAITGVNEFSSDISNGIVDVSAKILAPDTAGENTGVTAIIQSSSASVGILQALSTTGAITYSAAIPIILGQNIGTCITAFLSSVGGSKNARRTAMVHFYFNLIGSILFLIGIYAIQYTVGFSFWDNAIDKGGIANFHTLFNLTCTVLFLPFTGLLVKLATASVPAEETQEDPLAKLEPRFLTTPSLALDQAQRCIADMGDTAKQNFHLATDPLFGGAAANEEIFHEHEAFLDRAEVEIGRYLTTIHNIRSVDQRRQMAEMMHSLSDFEKIGDYAQNIFERADEFREAGLSFSPSAMQELRTMCEAVAEVLDMTVDGYDNQAVSTARMVEPLEEVVDTMKERLKSRHIERLGRNECTMQTGIHFLDIVHDLEKISDHCSNIAIYTIQLAEGAAEFDTHAYVKQAYKETPQFAEKLKFYQNKYLTKIDEVEAME